MSSTPPPRLRSIDALRGLDMLLIVGGREVLVALAGATGWRTLHALAGQLRHAEWHGFTLWDGVFPLFLFLAGASLPLSFARRAERGATRGELARHACARGLRLVLLGLVVNGLLAFDLAHLRVASVLGRIGLAWTGAALLVLLLGLRAQVVAALALLLGYWALVALVPAPDRVSPSLEPGATIVDWFDRRFLPGRLHREVRDPEGLLGTLPAVVTALTGSWAGRWLAHGRAGAGRRSAVLGTCGLAAVALGWLWSRWLPLNKNLWTSSFTLLTAGGSAVLLALFHWTIDVRGWSAWSFPLVVVGANAITIYVAHAFVDFEALARLVFGVALPARLHEASVPLIALMLEWLGLYALWRRKLLLRI